MEAESDEWQDVALIMNGWTYGPDATEALRWHRPEQVGVWNWERFNSQEFEDLYQQAIVEFDDAKRHEILVRMQDLMEESGAYTFFAHGVGRKRLCRPHRSGDFPGWLPDACPPLQATYIGMRSSDRAPDWSGLVSWPGWVTVGA